jgi:hypothetical protein
MELLFVVVIALIPAIIAKTKGRSFMLWWLYGFLLWIVALPHAIIIKTVPSKDTKRCLFCAEIIKVDANVCRFCGRDVTMYKVVV